MKPYLPAVLALFSVSTALQAATITVTTIDSDAPAVGTKSLKQALQEAHSGDTVAFNIPGDGPHYLPTPAGGYPLLRLDSIKIDGYTQPGSSPNNHSILQSNNAKIQIVLDSRNGHHTLLDFAADNAGDNTGYGDTESAVLAFHTAKGAEVSGVSILGTPAVGESADIALYGISFAHGASGHVHGCWIGVDPDGQTLAGPKDGITGFRYQDKSQQPQVNLNIDDIVIGVRAKAVNARAEFNVITGIPVIPIIIEGNRTRISGNFLNVQPSGINDFIPALDPDLVALAGHFEGHVEIGRGGNNTLVGVDGDGVNDADERNVLGGMLPPSLKGYKHSIEFYGNSPGSGIVLAGNYVGIGIDGSTRFTNGIPVLDADGGAADYRFGSNMDGVSDAIEGNVVANNYPADLFAPADLAANASSLSFFDALQPGGSVSARGNRLINNAPFPVSPLKGNGAFLQGYFSRVLADSVAEAAAPVLADDSTSSRLRGTIAAPSTDYPTVVLDVYLADKEGLATSVEAAIPDYPNFFTQGRTYLGSFVVDSADDLDTTANHFEFNISKFGGGTLTVTANYSKDAAGTRGAAFLTTPFSNPVTLNGVPGDAASVALARIKPDQILFDVDGLQNQDNWEPYTSVLGNSVFLIEANTHAEDVDGKQRYALAFQKVVGGEPVIGEGFYADNKTPYRGQINASRQNGNPGRVAGDKRPGASHLIVGGEASPHVYEAFKSDNRWDLGFDRGVDGRYGTIQIYDLDLSSLSQTPLTKALDAANGRLTEGAQQGGQQISRYGGDVAVLDNGNLLSVVADKTKLRNPSGDTAAATIFAADGSVVKETFAIGASDIWQNAAAIKGGFVVREAGVLYFFDNSGNARGSVSDSTSGGQFDKGRGDGTRLAGHINSPYVFLAGVSGGKVVRLAAWDSRDLSFVALIDVSDAGIPDVKLDRANLAVDALNRVTVAYEAIPTADFPLQQILIRVLELEAQNGRFVPLTASFFPFVNNGTVLNGDSAALRTFRPSVSMTTREILIAAKGEINKGNVVASGPDSQKQTTFYTVIAHPAPKADPTTPIDTGRPTVSILRDGVNVVIRFTGTLQTSGSVSAPSWQPVAGATSPLTLTPAQQSGNQYYRSSR